MPPFIADTFHLDEPLKPQPEADPKPLPRQAQILTDALALLRRDGWCNKALWDPFNRSCIAGACIRAAGDRETFSRIGWNAWWRRNMLHLQYPDEFNDAPGRTFAEIEDWFADKIEFVRRAE